MIELDPARRAHLLAQLMELEEELDVLLIDTGAGIGPNVLGFAAAASSVLVVTTPEPPALTDAYGAIKVMVTGGIAADIQVVVNMVTSEAEAHDAFGRLAHAAQRCLHTTLRPVGSVPLEPSVRDAVRQRLPFSLVDPSGRASMALCDVADRLLGHEPPRRMPVGGFFRRLSSWLGRTT